MSFLTLLAKLCLGLYLFCVSYPQVLLLLAASAVAQGCFIRISSWTVGLVTKDCQLPYLRWDPRISSAQEDTDI